ncbi:MAG TPA: hypothetical protein VFT22_12485 [Kofleriaceae bacterium]|nr:hypothetical protein [Kofleriaceae bacterium]
MKLAALALLTTLGLGGAAHADPARVDPPAAPAPPHGELRRLLLERFDRNHDGRLEPRERRRAIRALRRLAHRLALQERRLENRSGRQRALTERYDVNGDGVVGPEEMPPGLARRLRPLDRNQDGWLDDGDDQP